MNSKLRPKCLKKKKNYGVNKQIYIKCLGVFCSPCDRPRVIDSLRGKEVVDIAAGGAHSACITANGELYTWGKGRYGRLGHGDSEDQPRPKLVCFSLKFYSCIQDTNQIHVLVMVNLKG